MVSTTKTTFEPPALVEADVADRKASAGAVWEVIALDEILRPHRSLVSEVWCRVAAPRRGDLWRVYQVRAAARAQVLARVAECVCRSAAIVTVYAVTAPPTLEQLSFIDRSNNRLRAQRDMGRRCVVPGPENGDAHVTRAGAANAGRRTSVGL